MTASTVKSVAITSIETVPQALIGKVAGKINTIVDKITLATTSLDEVGDIILMCPIPSNAIITQINIYNDDLDSNGTPTIAADVGLYYSGLGQDQVSQGKTSGTVIDANNIATAITTLQAANKVGVNVRFEAAALSTYNKEAWDLGGLTTEIKGWYYIGLTLTTEAATAAAGDIVMHVEYLLN